MMDYQFDGRISKEVLENYLSRAVTAAGLYESETLSWVVLRGSGI